MQFIPLRGRIILLAIVLVLIIGIIIIMRANENSTASTENIGAVSPTADLRHVVVKTANADVYGTHEVILTDKNGKTLYYSKQDVFHKVSCTGDCTYAWMPLLFKGTGPLITSTKLPGRLTTDRTVNGNQVAYNGHYLYTFSGDSTPGDIQGHGRNDEWYVATPNLR